ncbi:transcriptional regulator [Halobacteriales archaeon QS_1_68_17]|nr:MAG: transcriptional regulator [Halobacteriales archaeon QS_1_68_17]
METRKVQLSGGTTYTISLPKSWAEEHGIEAGSVLRLHPETDGTLLVESTGEDDDRVRSGRVDVARHDAAGIRETLYAMYAVGFDEITLVDPAGHDTGVHRAVADAAGQLSGLEVMEETDTTITLRSLIDAGNISIRKSMLRLRLTVLAMHRDATTAFVDADPDLAAGLAGRDDEVDKLFALVARHFRQALSDLQEVEKLDQSRDALFEHYHVARQLERVGDHAEKIGRLADQQPGPPPAALAEEVSTYADRSRRIIEQASDVVLSDADVPVAYDVLDDAADLGADVDDFSRTLYERETTGAIHRAILVLDSLKRTAEYGANIAEMAIQRSVRAGTPE